MLGTPKPRGVLGGLGANPNVQAFGRGRAMEAASGLGMDRAQKAQQSNLQQMQADSQLRQQGYQNRATRAGNDAQQRTRQADLTGRRSAFDMGMRFDYAALDKRRNLDLRQALLNNMSRDF